MKLKEWYDYKLTDEQKRLLDDIIDVYDLNQYIKNETDNLEESFWFKKIAIFKGRYNAGCYVDYEAVGNFFKSITEETEFDINDYDPEDENVIYIRPTGKFKTRLIDVMHDAPVQIMKGSEFFTKATYNDRCYDNFCNLVDYLERIGYFDTNVRLDASLKEGRYSDIQKRIAEETERLKELKAKASQLPEGDELYDLLDTIADLEQSIGEMEGELAEIRYIDNGSASDYSGYESLEETKDCEVKEFDSSEEAKKYFDEHSKEFPDGTVMYDNKIYFPKEKVNEDIEKHDTLNPVLFDGEELKPEIKEAIQKIVDEFLNELSEDEIGFLLKDIVLLGSNASYNYNKDSDLDVHLIVDSNQLQCPKELQDKLYSAYRSIFNKNYDINIKGIPVEIFVELDEPRAKSNGIYSLNNGWLKKPEAQAIPEIDKEAFDKLFKEWEDKYKALVGEKDA